MSSLYDDYRKQYPNAVPEGQHKKTKVGRPKQNLLSVYMDGTYNQTVDKLKADSVNRKPQ